MSRRALMVLTTVITLVWVANFIAGVVDPDWSPAAINGIFLLVVGILYRSWSKKNDEIEASTPKRKTKPKAVDDGGGEPE